MPPLENITVSAEANKQSITAAQQKGAEPEKKNEKTTDRNQLENISEADKKPVIEKQVEKKSLWSKIEEIFEKSPPAFQKFRDWINPTLNTIGILFNTSAVMVKGMPIVGKPLEEAIDKSAEWFSRYIIPLSFSWNGLESLVTKKPLRALARWIPAGLFWKLPFYNFNLATGLSSAGTYLLSLVDKRYDDKTPDSSFGENIKATLKSIKSIFKDWTSGNFKKGESAWDALALTGMTAGSLGGLLLTGGDRDSPKARIFGALRQLGGAIGDLRFIFSGDIHKQISGTLMIIASACNFFMRWVGEDTARIFFHLATATDDLGLTYWAQEDKRRADAEKKARLAESEPKNIIKGDFASETSVEEPKNIVKGDFKADANQKAVAA